MPCPIPLTVESAERKSNLAILLPTTRGAFFILAFERLIYCLPQLAKQFVYRLREFLDGGGCPGVCRLVAILIGEDVYNGN
jgi:hypothetical protein